MQLSVTTVARSINQVVGSTEKWASIEDTLPGFKEDVVLYAHQRTIIQSLIDIEDTRTLVVDCVDYRDITAAPIQVESASCVLSEPFGSGKTIMLLGLILARPIPMRMRPQYISMQSDYHNDTTKFKTEIVRTYTGPRALIRPTLIVVGSSVLVQWQEAIEQFTHLRVLVVGGHHDLLQFRALYEDSCLGRYDIVLVKAGKTSATADGIRTTRSTLAVLADAMEGSIWARVIYDDFDTIDIGGAVMLPAIFTVFVSTTKARGASTRRVTCVYDTIIDAIDANRPPVGAAMIDAVLYGAFNVRNTPEYTKLSTNMPRIQVWRYVYDNPDDAYMLLLCKMGDDDATRIMEMLNGDAIGTAAEQMGIKTNSVANIFERMLDKKYKRYMKSNNVLLACDAQIEHMRKLVAARHTIAEIGAVEAALARAQTTTLTHSSPALDRAVSDIVVEYTVRKEQDGKAVHRVIDNAKEGECQVCRLPLDEGSVIIIKCCGVIVCDECGIKGCNIRRGFDYKSRANTLHGTCCHCKVTIYPQTDFIYLDQGFDIEALLRKQVFADTDEAAPVTPEAVAPPTQRNPKISALLDIVKGKTAPNQASIPLNVIRVVDGDNIIPTTGKRKVLVFASWNETLIQVEDALVSNNIEFLHLHGTAAEKAADLHEFRTGAASVLLINALETCAGINAQFATDLVFMHKNNNAAIEAQIVGRIQRIGRTCSAQVHFLCYANESPRV